MTIAILGLGKVGTSLARYFHSLGEEVWGIDDKINLKETHPELEKYCRKLFLGGEIPAMESIHRFFISPGVDPRHPAAHAAVTKGLSLEGELDLAYSLCRGEILAITGTTSRIQYEPAGQTFVMNRIGDPRRAKKDLGFAAETSLDDGLRMLISWRDSHKTLVDKRRSQASS